MQYVSIKISLKWCYFKDLATIATCMKVYFLELIVKEFLDCYVKHHLI